LEKTFDLLVTGPNPLALDATSLDGLPDRAIPLGELKAMLLHPSMAFAARDAVVDELVARSRSHGGAWTVGLAGVLLPGLRRAVWPLVQACPGKAADIEAETLVAFLAAVARCEPGRARLASRLCWLARIGADRLLRAEVAERARPGTDPVSSAPPRPWGHPDLVLERAVRAGVIGASDAELIGATRIGDVELAEVANALGTSYKACHQRRRRAESALVKWLTSDRYSPFEFVEKGPENPCSSNGGRPRQGRSMDRRPDKRRSTPMPRR
jgi:DNA-directed RNA polymerase specialized sigma24 family protein